MCVRKRGVNFDGSKCFFTMFHYEVRLRKSRHANLFSKNQFFRENAVVIAFSELRPGSNERYENSSFYGPFIFLIFILIFFLKRQFCISV